MAINNPTPRVTKHQQLREDTVVTMYAKAWGFFDQNRGLVLGILGGLGVLVLLVVAYTFYQKNQEQKAQELLATAVAPYEAGNYRAALDGADGKAGLLALADDYGRTSAGNMAAFYAADALFRLGEYDRALQYFGDFDKDENLIGASALAGEAAVYESKKEFKRAGDLYKEAALFFEADLTSPQYLLSAGNAYEQAGAFDAAREAYNEVKERFPESSAAEGVDFYLARIDAAAQQPQG